MTDCQHADLTVDQGDYYVVCRGCGAAWGRVSKPEYVEDKMGQWVRTPGYKILRNGRSDLTGK